MWLSGLVCLPATAFPNLISGHLLPVSCPPQNTGLFYFFFSFSKMPRSFPLQVFAHAVPSARITEPLPTLTGDSFSFCRSQINAFICSLLLYFAHRGLSHTPPSLLHLPITRPIYISHNTQYIFFPKHLPNFWDYSTCGMVICLIPFIFSLICKIFDRF